MSTTQHNTANKHAHYDMNTRYAKSKGARRELDARLQEVSGKLGNP